MTCVVGILDKGKVYMGADSAGVAGDDLRIRKDSKVFKNGEFLIGYTSSFRMGQLLRYNFHPPRIKENQDVFEYMVTDFIDSVIECLKNGGYMVINNNENIGGTFLVGGFGRLFCIEDDFQVGEIEGEYNAVGCGASYALGSLYATSNLKPEERMIKALSAAVAFNSAVRGPFNMLTL